MSQSTAKLYILFSRSVDPQGAFVRVVGPFLRLQLATRHAIRAVADDESESVRIASFDVKTGWELDDGLGEAAWREVEIVAADGTSATELERAWMRSHVPPAEGV